MIASFDIGIKNLGMCIIRPTLEVKGVPHPCEIVQWRVMNLLNDGDDGKCKHGNCRKSGTVKFGEVNLCLQHGEMQLKTYDKRFQNLHGLSTPLEIKKRLISANQSKNYLSLTKDSVKIRKLCLKSNISDNLLALIPSVGVLINQHFLVRTSCKEKQSSNSSSCCLIEVARNLIKMLDETLANILPEILSVKIENQLGPLAVRMKIIQGFITSYFIMRNPKAAIFYISSTQKLRVDSPGEVEFASIESPIESREPEFAPRPLNYEDRKKSGVVLCRKILLKYVQNNAAWIEMLESSKKKDDLCDSFLQSFC